MRKWRYLLIVQFLLVANTNGGDFIGATLKDCRFTQIKKNVRLKFNSCKLLENCLFSGEIHKAHFGYSNLKNCTFEGLLYDCSFEGVEKIGNLRKGEIIPPEKWIIE